jgi:hypothetical protein
LHALPLPVAQTGKKNDKKKEKGKEIMIDSPLPEGRSTE